MQTKRKIKIAVGVALMVCAALLVAGPHHAGAVLFAGQGGQPDGEGSKFFYSRVTNTVTVPNLAFGASAVVGATGSIGPTINANTINASGTITGNLTGNVTGNLSGNVAGSFPGEIRAYCTGTVGSAQSDYLNNAACSGATSTTGALIVSTVGTLQNLQVNMLTAVKASASGVAMTVYQNGSPTTITCTVATNTKTCSDTTHTVAVNPGDIIAFLFGATNSSDTAANVGAAVQKY